LFLALVAAWVWAEAGTGAAHLGIGRGYHTLEFDARPSNFALKLTRYATPLTRSHPDAPFFHTHGFGWFVDNAREREWMLGPIEFEITQADFEYTNTVFLTDWRVRCPYWPALLATLIPPVRWLAFKIRTRARKAKD
jgi:hypothetical protein